MVRVLTVFINKNGKRLNGRCIHKNESCERPQVG